MSKSVTFDLPQWQKLQRFTKFWTPDAERMMIQAIQKGVKRLSQEQQSQAPRKTGFLASNTVPIMEPKGASAVSKADYAIFVDRGTWRMPARPFFTDPMKKNIPIIINEVNTAFAMSIKKYFA